MGNELSLFIPIAKIDAEKREVWGIASEEVLDKTGEIFDYESSKPYVLEWSRAAERATGGKSKGNLRAMHLPISAGKLIALTCDDATKTIHVGAKVIDDGEWAKVKEGVYPGFSWGGKYVKKWADKLIAAAVRYTAMPFELSLADNPAQYGAIIQMVKTAGGEYQRVLDRFASFDPSVLRRLCDHDGRALSKNFHVLEELAEVLEHLRCCAAELDISMAESPARNALRDAAANIGDVFLMLATEAVDTLRNGDEAAPALVQAVDGYYAAARSEMDKLRTVEAPPADDDQPKDGGDPAEEDGTMAEDVKKDAEPTPAGDEALTKLVDTRVGEAVTASMGAELQKLLSPDALAKALGPVLTGALEPMQKALGEVQTAIKAQGEDLTKITSRVDALEKMPAPAKGVVSAVADRDATKDEALPDDARGLIKSVHRQGGTPLNFNDLGWNS